MAEAGYNFFVITGGPGAGKTSIIDKLAARGFPTVMEAGRDILRQQALIGGNATHTGDARSYAELILARGMADYERMLIETDGPVFFDRGVAELAGYWRLLGMPVPDHVRRAAELYRTNPLVFAAPPWREIYVQDALRGQDFAEAERTHDLAVGAYREFGYRIVEIPKGSVAERVAFVVRQADAALG